MKFIHTGDFHIGASHPFSKSSDVMFMRALETLNKVKERHADMLFLTGDLFDRDDVKVSTVDRFFNQVASLGIPVFIVLGNHDGFLRNQTYKRHLSRENLYTFNKSMRSHAIGSIVVHGFNTADFDLDALKAINNNLDQSKVNILCLHGEVLNPRDAHYLTSLKILQAMDFDYVALGHIHKHTVYDGFIVYSGNIEPLDFSEVEAKGIIEGTLEKPVSFAFHQAQRYRFNHQHIDISEGLESAVDKYLKTYADETAATTFHRLILTGQRDHMIDVKDSVFDRLHETFGAVEIKNETRPKYDDLNALKKTYKGSIVETLVEIHEADEGDADAFELALEALLETGEGFDDY